MTLFSFDDGTPEDLQIIEILKEYQFRTIFFIPIESWGFEHIDEYTKHPFIEIGGHTWTHPSDLKLLPTYRLNTEIKQSYAVLVLRLGHLIDWFCYPRGRFDERVKDMVINAGYKYARTTRNGNGGSEYEREGYHCYPRKEYNGVDWLQYIKDRYIEHQGNIHIWGHSKEIIERGELGKFKELCKFVAEHPYVSI